jgi:hypothetical protein
MIDAVNVVTCTFSIAFKSSLKDFKTLVNNIVNDSKHIPTNKVDLFVKIDNSSNNWLLSAS